MGHLGVVIEGNGITLAMTNLNFSWIWFLVELAKTIVNAVAAGVVKSALERKPKARKPRRQRRGTGRRSF